MYVELNIILITCNTIYYEKTAEYVSKTRWTRFEIPLCQVNNALHLRLKELHFNS